METAWTSETLISYRNAAGRHNLKVIDWNLHCPEKHKLTSDVTDA